MGCLVGLKIVVGTCVGIGTGFFLSHISTVCQEINTSTERQQQINDDLLRRDRSKPEPTRSPTHPPTRSPVQRVAAETQSKQSEIFQKDDDWFNASRWSEFGASESCFHVENICRVSHSFFYDPHGSANVHQPDFKLKRMALGQGYPRSFRPFKMHGSLLENQCHYSPIPNHMVLQSWYSGMLGEFYVRVLPALHFLKETQSSRSDSDASWRSNTQLYLHIQNDERDLMDSHKLFSEPFSANTLLPFKALFDQAASCTCYKRLFLCGYERVEDQKAGKKQTEENSVVLKPSEYVNIPAGDKRPIKDRFYHYKQWGDLQKSLRASIISKPSIQRMVKNERARIITNVAGGMANTSAWKIVGFTQRSVRRRWLKLSSIVKKCNQQFNPEQIACVEVNVESKESNVVNQAVMHNALDAIIGIHGAQLAEAVWMNDGAAVLELLPYIPDPNITWGFWTRWTRKPTPLGIIFNDTHINHVGIRLPERSSRDCKYNYKDDFRCWREHPWDSSDFVVDYYVAERFIRNFVREKKKTEMCKELQRRAKKEENYIYILYNYVCVDSGGDSLEVHHFWDKEDAKNQPLKI